MGLDMSLSAMELQFQSQKMARETVEVFRTNENPRVIPVSGLAE